jgi:glycerol uptake facilitator-like aquaporin
VLRIRDLGVLPGLTRRAVAEAIGTAGLVCAVVGSGIAAERLSPHDVGLQLLENSIATAMALVALILTFGSVSGAHLNPAVTAVAWVRRTLPAKDAVVFVLAQVAGGILGAWAANAMFERPVFETAAHVRTGLPLWFGEVVATVGLLLTIHGTARSNPKAIPVAVGSYIGAAYWFTSSTSFANPAVTIARAFSDSFAGIAPSSVPAFVLAQAVGAAIACVAIARLFSAPPETQPS